MTSAPLPKVLLVGRVNVGKSTLFNRILEKESALTSELPGTTRDRIEKTTHWRHKTFQLVDSGGFVATTKSSIERETLKQTERAIQSADVIVWVVDGKRGKHALDEALANLLRKQDKPVIICVNKVERDADRMNIAGEFESFGFSSIWPVSAFTGSGVGDLLDAIVEELPEITTETTERKQLRLTFVGKPNVGKSSLINTILNDERVIVSDMPHTTRESQDIDFEFEGRGITLVDTAGIHPVKKIIRNTNLAFQGKLEAKGIRQTERSIESADVVAFVIESHGSMSSQDFRIADLIAKHSTVAVMIVANKWDLLEDKTTTTVKAFSETLDKVLPMLKGAPVLTVSATERQRVNQILPTALQLHKRQHKTIPPDELRTFLEKFTRENVLRSNVTDGRRKPLDPPEFYTLKQTSVRPRIFEIAYKSKLPLPARYLGQMHNQIVETFDLAGIQTKLVIKRL